jgi:acyl dehydratase
MYAFFQTVGADELVERLGFSWGRTLGARIEFETHMVLGEEETVVGQSVVEAACEQTRRDGSTRQSLRLRTDFHDDDGSLACRTWALFVEHRVGPRDPAAASVLPDVGSAPTPYPMRNLGPALDGVVGQVLPAHRVGPLDRLQLARMSIAVDNPDPVHVDDAAAQKMGLAQVIGSGSGAAGMLYEPVRQWAGIARVSSASVRLLAPYSVGVELVITGTIENIDIEAGPGGQLRYATCNTQLATATGSVVAEARFRVLMS